MRSMSAHSREGAESSFYFSGALIARCPRFRGGRTEVSVMPPALTPARRFIAVRPCACASAAREMLAAAEAGQLSHFTLHLDRLDAHGGVRRQGRFEENYPSLKCRCMRAGGISNSAAKTSGRRSTANRRGRDKAARARAAFDLAIVSVLLDAGAGLDWRYRDGATGW